MSVIPPLGWIAMVVSALMAPRSASVSDLLCMTVFASPFAVGAGVLASELRQFFFGRTTIECDGVSIMVRAPKSASSVDLADIVDIREDVYNDPGYLPTYGVVAERSDGEVHRIIGGMRTRHIPVFVCALLEEHWRSVCPQPARRVRVSVEQAEQKRAEGEPLEEQKNNGQHGDPGAESTR